LLVLFPPVLPAFLPSMVLLRILTRIILGTKSSKKTQQRYHSSNTQQRYHSSKTQQRYHKIHNRTARYNRAAQDKQQSSQSSTRCTKEQYKIYTTGRLVRA
jgi:hypothetical protein